MKVRVYRKDGIYDCLILKHKLTNQYSFVNLTKEHICPCLFNSIDDALKDLDNYIKQGKVIKYKILKL